MPRPRGDDWLEEEIQSLEKQHVNICISLLEQQEITELGLQKEPEHCANHGIEYINFPIPDRNIPQKGKSTDNFINTLTQKIQGSQSIVIHCRMGIGRSSIIAASILLTTGLTTEQIINKISTARGLKVPDTLEQVKWLKEREKSAR